jgi:hypothetical protein
MPLANPLAWTGPNPTHDEAVDEAVGQTDAPKLVADNPKRAMTRAIPYEFHHLLPRLA